MHFNQQVCLVKSQFVEFLSFLLRLSQSVVLWQGIGGIQKIALFCKRPSPYYGKNSSNKQSETTVHHYFKTWRSVNLEHFKNISSSAVAKTIKRYDDPGSHEYRHRKGRPKVTFAAEDKFITVACLRNCSPNQFLRVQVTYTSQHQLFRRDCVSQAFMVEKKPLLSDINKKKRLAWSKKHKQWTLDRWKSVLMSPNVTFFVLTAVSLWDAE